MKTPKQILEEQIIITDLNEFLKDKGIESLAWRDFLGDWGLVVDNKPYYVEHSSIYSYRQSIVSLSDPQYREKLLEHIKRICRSF